MASLEDIVASLTDRLRSLELENQALQQGIRPENIREPKARTPRQVRRHPQTFPRKDEKPHSARIKPKSKYPRPSSGLSDKVANPAAIYAAEFRQLTADIDWNDAAIRSQFYSGLSSEIKDHLVHCESPVSLAAAMDQAIPTFCSESLQLPSEPRLTTDDMDIDFARRGPLTSSERQQRFSQGLCLVCGKSGHLKATCPWSNSRFRPQRQVQAIEMEGHSNEASGNDLGRL
ncbi:hypothetical protein BASA83_013558 [Batrachochytrium salamandrivorans]|nr:hypothetical protein BASA83_013558 [Batrachochytrium salamandrivorans]